MTLNSENLTKAQKLIQSPDPSFSIYYPMKNQLYPHDRIESSSQLAEIDDHESFALDVFSGLSSQPKYIPSQYLYDQKGSQLFTEIMNAEDYYVTQCEYDILQSSASDIATIVQNNYKKGKLLHLIELGAGDGYKTSLLLQALQTQEIKFTYIPIDISATAMVMLLDRLKNNFKRLNVFGLIADYFDGMNWLNNNTDGCNFVLFLGANIGNFIPSLANQFLQKIWYTLNSNDFLLLGCDLKKNIPIMERAYNDKQGYTKEFNLNLLKRMNIELGANFSVNAFQHCGVYNPLLGAMQSFLISQDNQQISIRKFNKTFSFTKYEPILIENSFKYGMDDIAMLAKNTNFKIAHNFHDSKYYFVDSLWQAYKEL